MPGVIQPTGQIIGEEGTGLTRRPTLNFIGSGVTAADNAGSNRTDVTITSSGITFAADSGLPVYNVKSSPYSALGDNSNDDTAEIQAAIDAASAAGGGIVFFPPGIYRISSALSLPSYVTLMGVGGAGGFSGTSYIRSTSASANHIEIVNASYSCSVKGLAFDKSVTATGGAAVYSTSVGRLLLEDVATSRLYDSFTLGATNTLQGYGGNGVWINRCDVNQPIHSGLTATGIIEGHVSECYFEASAAYAESTGYGIYLGDGCDGWFFSASDIIGYAVGVYIASDASNGYWDRVLVDACALCWDIYGREHTLIGCYAAACRLPTWAYLSGSYGIKLNPSAGIITIQGFYCRRATTAIQLDGGVDRVVISGCIIYPQEGWDVLISDPANGINLAGVVTNVIITGNMLHTQGDAYDNGGYSHVNLVYANNVEVDIL